jgi:hypothetical protein
VVTEPMQRHHDRINAQMDNLRNQIQGLSPSRTPGRPCPYPRSKAYGVKERRLTPATPWKEIYRECKRRCATRPVWKKEKLPDPSAYEAAVRRALRGRS